MTKINKTYDVVQKAYDDERGDSTSVSLSNDLLCDDELLKRAKELQENMFPRDLTLTDNGTVSLLIERVCELYRERQSLIDELNT